MKIYLLTEESKKASAKMAIDMFILQMMFLKASMEGLYPIYLFNWMTM